MKTENKAYVHISRVDKEGAEEHVAQPPKAVEKLVAEGKDFKQFSTLDYVETSFTDIQEFIDIKMPDGSPVDAEVKLAIVNRGWVLAQQAVAKDLVLDDDVDFVTGIAGATPKTGPVDISGEVLSPKKGGGRKRDPEASARKSLRDLLTADPEKLAQLIAEFAAQNASVVG